MPPPTTPSHGSLAEALAAHGTAGLYVHFGEHPSPAPDVSGHAPDVPAGIPARPAASIDPAAGFDTGWAITLRPTKVARLRTLDSATYTALRFHEDFVALSERQGAHAHAALKVAMAEANPRTQPFLCLCLTTRHLADRPFLARGELDAEGSRRVWAALLVEAGYDILVDRGVGVLPGDGPQAVILRADAVRAEGCVPSPDAASPAPR